MKKYLLAIFLCFAIGAHGQDKHHLSKQIQAFDSWTNDNISDASNCWIHNNLSYDPNGNILNVNTSTDRKEGSASHNISYQMSSLDANISVKRSYGAYPRDFSYKGGGITFWIKGQQGNNDEVRVILSEGKDAYVRPNEIFQYYINQNNPNKTKVLTNAEWKKIFIPFSDFTLFYDNGGDRKINLDRIGQIEIQVINKTNSNHRGSFHIDDLRWETTATTPSESNKLIRSIILPLHVRDNCVGIHNWHNWSVDEWVKELNRMANMGIEKVIIQYSQVIYDSEDVYDKNTNLGRYNNAASYLRPVDNQNAPWIIKSYATINNIFEACIKLRENHQKRIDIELGLAHYEPYWNVNTSHYGEQSFYNHMIKHVKVSVDDLSNLLKHERYQSVFVGWYIPQEFNELYWDTDNKINLLADYYMEICDYIRSKDPIKPISMAPFFYGYLSVNNLSEWYSHLFQRINKRGKRVDLLYMQDGIGIGEHRVGIDLKQFVPPIKEILKNTGGTELGIILETFDSYDCQGRDTTDLGNISKMTRIRRQLSDALDITKDINKISVFSWADFQTSYPGIDRDSENLYQDYLKVFADQLAPLTYTGGNMDIAEISTDGTVTVLKSDSVKMTDQLRNSSMTVYPNPVLAGEIVCVKTDDTEVPIDATLEVYNMLGYIMSKTKITERLTYVTAPNHSGIYMFKLQSKNGLDRSFRIIVK